MFSTVGVIQGNTVLAKDNSLEKFNGRKVIITVLDEESNLYETLSDEKLIEVSDSLISQNLEAYKELAK